jgi:anaerobic selenocysteine-containing dehydrogenase
MKALRLDPVADFTPPSESRHGTERATFPLELLARKADNFLNSTFSNQPSVQQMEEVESSGDAFLRRPLPWHCQRRDGSSVQPPRRNLFKARVDGAVQPGVVSARLNWAKLSPGLRNINVLTSEKLSDLGNSATFYSVLVDVESTKSIP